MAIPARSSAGVRTFPTILSSVLAGAFLLLLLLLLTRTCPTTDPGFVPLPSCPCPFLQRAPQPQPGLPRGPAEHESSSQPAQPSPPGHGGTVEHSQLIPLAIFKPPHPHSRPLYPNAEQRMSHPSPTPPPTPSSALAPPTSQCDQCAEQKAAALSPTLLQWPWGQSRASTIHPIQRAGCFIPSFQPPSLEFHLLLEVLGRAGLSPSLLWEQGMREEGINILGD